MTNYGLLDATFIRSRVDALRYAQENGCPINAVVGQLASHQLDLGLIRGPGCMYVRCTVVA